MSIEEEVKRGEIAEGDVFSERSSLLLTKRIKKSPMKITDFLLSNGGKRVDGVEPDIEPVVFGQLIEACVLEFCRVFNAINCLDKACSQGKNVLLFIAEVLDIVIELVYN